MKRKQLLFLMLTMLSGIGAKAQNEGSNYFRLDVYSGELAKLPIVGANGNVDFSGRTDITIPLYTVKIDGTEVPIRLIYDPNALKVDARASWVGLGWTLSGAGYINRNVNQFPDDIVDLHYDGLGMSPHAINKRGFGVGGARLTDEFPLTGTEFDKSTKLWCYNAGWRKVLSPSSSYNTNDKCADTEPDEFSYNLLGKSGKFVFGHVIGVPAVYTIPYDNIDINYNIDNFTNYYKDDNYPANSTVSGSLPNPYQGDGMGISNFTIKDDGGRVFHFDNSDTVYTAGFFTLEGRPGCNSAAAWNMPSGVNMYSYRANWLLTNVETPNKKNINFTFYRDSIFTYSSSNTSRRMDLNFSQNQYPSDEFRAFTCKSYEKKIKSIETDNELVQFIEGPLRQDVVTDHVLQQIKVYRKINGSLDLIRTITFNYDYFLTNNDVQYFGDRGAQSIYDDDTHHDDKTKKLKLVSIQFSGNGITFPPYTFSYNEDLPIPRINSVNQDIWGYYNNIGNNQPLSIFPAMYVYPNKYGLDRYTTKRRMDWVTSGETEIVLSGGNRNVNPTAITTGTLKKITFPTGGAVSYEFEANDYEWAYTYDDFYGSGMRIKKTTTYDGISHANDIVYNFSYKQTANNTVSSGLLLAYPQFGYTQNTCARIGLSSTDNPGVYNKTAHDYYDKYMWRLNRPLLNKGIDLEATVGYREITVSSPGNGRKVLAFDVPGAAGETVLNSKYDALGLNNIFEVPIAYAIKGDDPKFDGTGDWSTHMGTIDQAGMDLSKYSYYAGPAVNMQWARGQIASESFFNNNNVLLKKKDYKYRLFSGPSGVVRVKSLKYSMSEFYSVLNSNGVPGEHGPAQNWIYSPYTQVADVKMVIDTVVETNYDGGTFTTLVDYDYPNALPSVYDPYPRKITTFKSDGSLISVNKKYARDYGLNTPGSYTSTAQLNGIPELLQNNMYGSEVETWVEINNQSQPKVVNGVLSEYKVLPGSVVPVLYKNWKLKTATPLTNFSPAYASVSGSTGSLVKDSRYDLEVSVDAVNSSGTPVQMTKRGDQTNAVITGYNDQYIIAKVQNAPYDGIAYTSFEDLPASNTNANITIGNWVFNGNNAFLNASDHITGKEGYNLNIAYPVSSKSNGLKTGRDYIVSFWAKNGSVNVNNGVSNVTLSAGASVSGWTYYEAKLTAQSPVSATTTNISLTGNSIIDELRLYPADAQMETHTYEPQIGVSATCDVANRIVYFEYDGMGRMVLVRDQDGNIVQKAEHAVQQPE